MNIKQVAAACRVIASGFDQLADALLEADVAGEAPAEEKPAKPATEKKPAKPDKPAAEEKPKDPPADEVEEVTLEDLQELGASMIKAKKRQAFVGVLEARGLKNLSSAPVEDRKVIWDELKKASEE